jgi:CCR4-NOT transcription complex subunit 1
MAESLLVMVLQFLEQFLKGPSVVLTDPVRLLYRGTLRVLLVLLHDYPEFLADHHFALCDAIPPTCVQMRNLVLSAFPRSMRLPDPFTQNLKVDRLPEIAVPPRVASDYTGALDRSGLRAGLDAFLTKTPGSGAGAVHPFLRDLPLRLGVSHAVPRDAGERTLPPRGGYDGPLINSLVMYVGTCAIASIQAKGDTGKDGASGGKAEKGGKKNKGGNNNSNNSSSNSSSGGGTPGEGATPPLSIDANAPMELFQYLASELCPEGRYLMLNAIANQLRFPNQHCHYFSFAMLYLFAESGRTGPPGRAELVREQITRVLLERLIVSRPHPWGQLISLLELIRNPRYAFWSHEFTRCAPEIQGVFKSVARSCMLPGPPGADQDESAGGNSTAGAAAGANANSGTSNSNSNTKQ